MIPHSLSRGAYNSTRAHGAVRRAATVDNLMTGDPIRILIVENQRFVSDALQALLSLQKGMVVVGNVGLVADSVAELKPDLVILEFHLNNELAAGVLRAICQTDSQVKVILMTNDEDDRVILAAIDGGASAVLYMSTAATEVIETIRTVAGGGSLISATTIATLLNGRRKTDGVRDRLTPREKEILGLMADGISNRDIAAKLGISYVTVRCHVRNLSGKLAAHSRLEALVRAQQLELIDRGTAKRPSHA